MSKKQKITLIILGLIILTTIIVLFIININSSAPVTTSPDNTFPENSPNTATNPDNGIFGNNNGISENSVLDTGFEPVPEPVSELILSHADNEVGENQVSIYSPAFEGNTIRPSFLCKNEVLPLSISRFTNKYTVSVELENTDNGQLLYQLLNISPATEDVESDNQQNFIQNDSIESPCGVNASNYALKLYVHEGSIESLNNLFLTDSYQFSI